jgi:CHASE1-domain containing sensor protein
MTIPDPQADFRHRVLRWLPGLILAGGLAITALVVKQIRQRETEAQRAEFELRVSEVVSGLHARLIANAQILRGVAGLFASSANVEREEFRRYVAGLRLAEYHPGIQAIGYAAMVPAAEKARHLAALRAEGFVEYDIRPPGDRETYSAVIYVEPFDAVNRRAFGFDLLTEPVRSAAAARARDECQAIMSDQVTLQQETSTNAQAGVLLFVPVYAHDLPMATVAQRQAAVRGWAYVALRVKDMMGAFLATEYTELSQRYAVQVYAGTNLSPATLLFDSHPGHGPGFPPFSTRRTLAVAGAEWTVRVTPLPAYWSGVRASGRSRTVIASGSCLTLALALVALVLSRSHLRVAATLEEARRANKALAQSTTELTSANTTLAGEIAERQRAEETLRTREAQLRLVTNHAPVAIAYCDLDRRYKFVNQL